MVVACNSLCGHICIECLLNSSSRTMRSLWRGPKSALPRVDPTQPTAAAAATPVFPAMPAITSCRISGNTRHTSDEIECRYTEQGGGAERAAERRSSGRQLSCAASVPGPGLQGASARACNSEEGKRRCRSELLGQGIGNKLWPVLPETAGTGQQLPGWPSAGLRYAASLGSGCARMGRASRRGAQPFP